MARQVLTGLKGKILKVLSTDQLLKEISLVRWTLVDADVVEERDVETLPTDEKVYDNDGNLIKWTKYKIITQRQEGRDVVKDVIERVPVGQTIYENGQVKYILVFPENKRAVFVKIFDNEANYIGKSLFQVGESGIISGASHFYYLGTLSQSSDLLTYISKIGEDDEESEDLVLFRVDRYSGGELISYTEHEYKIVSVNGDDTYILDYKINSRIVLDEIDRTIESIEPISKTVYEFAEIGDLDKEFMSRYIRFWNKVAEWNPNTDLLVCETGSYPSNKVKKTKVMTYFYRDEEPNLSAVSEFWYMDIDEILNNNPDNELNIYNYFSDPFMQEFLNTVINNFDLVDFVEFLKESISIGYVISKCESHENIGSYLTEDYKEALFYSSTDLFRLKHICLDPLEGLIKYEAKYDKKFRIIEEQYVDIYGTLTELKTYEYRSTTDEQTGEIYDLQIYTLADGNGNNQVVIERLEQDNTKVYGGKIFTYREDGRIHQIDRYLKGSLTLVECYLWETLTYEEKIKTDENATLLRILKDDEFETRSETYLKKVGFYNAVNDRVEQELFYSKGGTVSDNRLYRYDGSGRVIAIEIYSSQGYKSEIVNYTYSVHGTDLVEPLPQNSIILDSKGKEIRKMVYIYNSDFEKTGFKIYGKETPSSDWTLSEEQYFDSEGNLTTEKDYKSDVITEFQYNEV